MSDNVINFSEIMAKRNKEKGKPTLPPGVFISDGPPVLEDDLTNLEDMLIQAIEGRGGEPGLLDRNPDAPVSGIDIANLNSDLIAQAITRMIVDHLFDYWGFNIESNPDNVYELVAIMEATSQLIDRATGNLDERHDMIMRDLSEYIGEPHEVMQKLMYPMFDPNNDEE